MRCLAGITKVIGYGAQLLDDEVMGRGWIELRGLTRNEQVIINCVTSHLLFLLSLYIHYLNVYLIH